VGGVCVSKKKTVVCSHEDVQHHEVVSDKNIKDRFYGSNDPMAQKIINKVLVPNVPISPEDKTITTLFMSGITDEITETDIRYVLSYCCGRIADV